MNNIDQNGSTIDQSQLTFEIRPGVKFPDWSVVTSEKARSALTDINEAFGIEKWVNRRGRVEGVRA